MPKKRSKAKAKRPAKSARRSAGKPRAAAGGRAATKPRKKAVRKPASRARPKAVPRRKAAPVKRPAAPKGPKNLNVTIWPIRTGGGTNPDLFDARTGEARFGPPWVGVSLSGGGARAMTTAMGALRGLRHLGLLDKVSWLSTVSGGTWAGTTYTYLPSTISDQDFLGPVVPDPGNYCWFETDCPNRDYALDYLPDTRMGSVFPRMTVAKIIEKAVAFLDAGVSTHALWCRLVGHFILEPFGLGDGFDPTAPATYFSYQPSWLERAILQYNRGLTSGDFYCTRTSTDRPFLVTNSIFLFPPSTAGKPATPNTMHPWEGTPTGVGIVPGFARQGAPVPGEPNSRDLGGGLVDPFGMGCAAPSKPVSSGRFNTPTPPMRYALSDMAGTSSSFYVDALYTWLQQYLSSIDDLFPIYNYWPVMNAGASRNSAYPYYYGDGGILENTGIAALLRRRVPRIIAFVNSEIPLAKSNGTVTIDPMISALFGQPTGPRGKLEDSFLAKLGATSQSTQVFRSSDYGTLVDNLWNASQAGGTAIYKQTLPVLANSLFGVPAMDQVTILWVYLNPVSWWYDRLTWEVRLAMDAEPWYYLYFPNYGTVDIELTKRQVNLLAHLSCWNVTNTQSIGGCPANATLMQSMFA
jgi:predicted acylesterase/phospholipase RssA